MWLLFGKQTLINGGKRLQVNWTTAQDIDDALQEIKRLQTQNNFMIGKVAELRLKDNELYHEFVSFTTQCINTLEERITSLNQWADDIFKIQDQKDKLIESLQQGLTTKENVLLALESKVK